MSTLLFVMAVLVILVAFAATNLFRDLYRFGYGLLPFVATQWFTPWAAVATITVESVFSTFRILFVHIVHVIYRGRLPEGLYYNPEVVYPAAGLLDYCVQNEYYRRPRIENSRYNMIILLIETVVYGKGAVISEEQFIEQYQERFHERPVFGHEAHTWVEGELQRVVDDMYGYRDHTPIVFTMTAQGWAVRGPSENYYDFDEEWEEDRERSRIAELGEDYQPVARFCATEGISRNRVPKNMRRNRVGEPIAVYDEEATKRAEAVSYAAYKVAKKLHDEQHSNRWWEETPGEPRLAPTKRVYTYPRVRKGQRTWKRERRHQYQAKAYSRVDLHEILPVWETSGGSFEGELTELALIGAALN